jgi:two-component system, OmpR family, sensor kinase
MSIRNRLTLGFFLITLAAIAVVFFYVTPTLEDRLRDEKLDQMRSAVEIHADTFEATIGTDLPVKAVQRLVADVSQQVNARVTLLNVPRGPLAVRPYPVSDSSGEVEASGLSFDIAERAVAQPRVTATGTEAGQGGRVAEAARVVERDGQKRVVVFSSSLSDVVDTVSLIRR